MKYSITVSKETILNPLYDDSNSDIAAGVPVFDELKKHVDGLKKLLDNPHPGLIGWCTMYATHMQWIANYWNGADPKDPATPIRKLKPPRE